MKYEGMGETTPRNTFTLLAELAELRVGVEKILA